MGRMLCMLLCGMCTRPSCLELVVLPGSRGHLDIARPPMNLILIPRNGPGRKGNIPALCYTHRQADVLVIYAHGNAQTIDHDTIPPFLCRALAADVLAFEYSGYGIAPDCNNGDTTRVDIEHDVMDCLDFAINKLGIPASKIFLAGRSIGTGVMAYAARQLRMRNTPAAGLILISPYVSVRQLVQNKTWFFFTWMAEASWWNTKECVGALDTTPVWMLSGTADSLTPYAHATELLEVGQKNRVDVVLETEASPDKNSHNTIPKALRKWEPSLQYWKRRVYRSEGNLGEIDYESWRPDAATVEIQVGARDGSIYEVKKPP